MGAARRRAPSTPLGGRAHAPPASSARSGCPGPHDVIVPCVNEAAGRASASSSIAATAMGIEFVLACAQACAAARRSAPRGGGPAGPRAPHRTHAIVGPHARPRPHQVPKQRRRLPSPDRPAEVCSEQLRRVRNKQYSCPDQVTSSTNGRPNRTNQVAPLRRPQLVRARCLWVLTLWARMI